MPSSASDRGRYSRDKGQRFERAIANALKPLYPDAHRGLQPNGENADVEGTDFWVECKDLARHVLLSHHRQAVEAQTTRLEGRGKNRKRVPRETPDERPRLIVVKERQQKPGEKSPIYACIELPLFLDLLRAYKEGNDGQS